MTWFYPEDNNKVICGWVSGNDYSTDQAPSAFSASYTRKAGQTIAFNNPRKPIQKPVACEM